MKTTSVTEKPLLIWEFKKKKIEANILYTQFLKHLYEKQKRYIDLKVHFI